MTTLLDRPGAGTREPGRPATPPLLVAAAAGVWAAVLGLIGVTVLVLLGWVASDHGSSSTPDAFRGALRVWLAAHRASFDLGGARLTLVPLGLSLLPLALIVPAGRWVARATGTATLREAGSCAAAIAVAYSAVVAALSPLASSGRVEVHAVTALGWSLLLAALGAGVGLVRAADLGDDLAALLPPRVRLAVRAASAGSCAVVAFAAALVAALLAGHLVVVADLAASLRPGWVGGVLLLLIGMCAVPTLVLWALAVIVGPGFAVGTGTSVAVTGVSLGAVPALPVLGVLPSAELPAPLRALPLLVVLAGVLVGVLVARGEPQASLRDGALLAVGSGVLAGAALGLLTSLSAGSLGSHRLAEVGPVGWQVGLIAAVELGAAAGITTALMSWRAARSGGAARARKR